MEVLDGGGREGNVGGSRGGEPLFESVEQAHQLLDAGDDAMLFGEGWDRDWKSPETA